MHTTTINTSNTDSYIAMLIYAITVLAGHEEWQTYEKFYFLVIYLAMVIIETVDGQFI